MPDRATEREPERRTTRQRRAIEEALREGDDFVSAQALHARLRERGEKIGIATVYRALAAMSEDGRVDTLRSQDGESLYRLCRSAEHHHHLVCRRCGHAVEVDGPGVERWAADTAAEHGFRDITHTLEVFGTCGDCAAAQATSA